MPGLWLITGVGGLAFFFGYNIIEAVDKATNEEGKTMLKTVTIEAPAKINLTLDVKGRRPDGYHEIETVMHQIDLVDRVSLRVSSEGIKVTADSPELPCAEDNLAFRAAVEFFRQVGATGGVEVFIHKRIPVGAGLAGGSSDAAAVIKGLNRLYGDRLTPDEMLGLGAKIGSDVPFCILGGTALARGRGEIVTPLFTDMTLALVLVKPDFAVSTKEVYERFDKVQIFERPDTDEVMRGLLCKDVEMICRGMGNVLEAVTTAWFPEVARIKQRMKGLGAIAALMSGSGPSVFGVFQEEGEAREAFGRFKLEYREVYLTKSYRKGEGKDAGKQTDSCEIGHV